MNNLYPPIEISDINKIRIKHMNDSIAQINKELLHYKKLKRKWNKISIISRVGGISIGVVGTGLGVGIGIVTAGIALPIIITGISIAEPVLTEVICDGFCVKKKNHFKTKIEHIEKTLNRLYLFIRKAGEDFIITDSELNEFENIIDDYNKGIEKISFKEDDKIFLDLKKTMDLELKKLIKQKSQ